MLAFAALTPHPLISIPEVGKEHRAKIRETMRSFKELSRELYAAKPDIVCVISPHGSVSMKAFTINQRPHVTIEFSKIGNLSDRVTLTNAVGFGYQIKESMEADVPIILVDDELLDYGAGIPLFHLLGALDTAVVRTLAIGTGTLKLHEHFAFGARVNKLIHRTTQRIAVIASGDLAHGVSKSDADHYMPQAVALNDRIRSAVESKDTRSILDITSEQLGEVSECGLRPLALLLGILDERQYSSRILSYESALGVGYLTAHFELT